jgi:hypothetical protein
VAAADLAINPMLVANGFSLPEGALIGPAFDNLSADEIYARLPQRNNGSNSTQPQSLQPSAGGNGPASPHQKPSQPSPGSSLDNQSGKQSVPERGTESPPRRIRRSA